MPALIPIAAAALAIAFLATPAIAQSLSPMQKQGTTPTLTKGFKVSVGNPYESRMTFLVTPMDMGLGGVAPDAVASPSRLTLAPGQARSVIVAFKIDPERKERTIALCIMPEEIAGPILPRVCGLYTGRLRGVGS